MVTMPLITHYTGLLHRHGVGSTEAQVYRDEYVENKYFQRSCDVMDQIFRLRDEVSVVEG